MVEEPFSDKKECVSSACLGVSWLLSLSSDDVITSALEFRRAASARPKTEERVAKASVNFMFKLDSFFLRGNVDRIREQDVSTIQDMFFAIPCDAIQITTKQNGE